MCKGGTVCGSTVCVGVLSGWGTACGVMCVGYCVSVGIMCEEGNVFVRGDFVSGVPCVCRYCYLQVIFPFFLAQYKRFFPNPREL